MNALARFFAAGFLAGGELRHVLIQLGAKNAVVGLEVAKQNARELSGFQQLVGVVTDRVETVCRSVDAGLVVDAADEL